MWGEEEDWLLDSIRLYNDLHVFALQEPTRVIEWTGEQSICVAGYENSRRNEILQLLLPEKLCRKENQGLCPERDFKLKRGGFSNRPLYSLKHVPQTRLVVTSSPLDDSLQVWGLEKEDLIKPLSTIPTAKGGEGSGSRLAASFSTSARVLHGLRIADLQVTEVESKKTIFLAGATNTDEATMLEFLDQTTVLVCSQKGQLFLTDLRQSSVLQGAEKNPSIPLAPAGERWCAGVGHGPQGGKTLVARLSSGGCMALTDLRNMESPVKAAKCPTPPSEHHKADLLSISIAPLLEECVAVSGFDGTIKVFDTHSWGSGSKQTEPSFVHKGHVFSHVADVGDPPLVTIHTWHHAKPRTLLSAACDGSLHVWDWADPQGDG